MWSAWVSKSTHTRSSGQPAAHSVGGWFLTGSGLQPSMWYYFACTTYTVAPVTTKHWSFNWRRMLRGHPQCYYLRGCWSGLLMVLVSNVLEDSASVVSMSLSFSLTHHKGELQRSCSRSVAEKVSEQCQLACHCRRYPPLPPPPPPPPPPRLLGNTGKTSWSHSKVSHLSCFQSVCLTRFVGSHSSPVTGVKRLSSLQEMFWREGFPFRQRKKKRATPWDD